MSTAPTPSSSPARVLERIRDGLLVGFLVFAGFHLLRVSADYAFEDAYITFRYADNLAAGNGFVFNLGERVLGTTTPLYTLLLGALKLVSLDPEFAGRLLYALGLCLTALTGAWILRRLGHPALGVAFALLTIFNAGRSWHFFGMETTLYSFFLLGSVAAAIARRPVLLGLGAACALLTRYDAVVLLVPLFFLTWLRWRRLPWKSLGVAVLVALPWFVFAQWYFGSVLPNTLDAKGHSTAFATYAVGSLAQFLGTLWVPFSMVDLHRTVSNSLDLAFVVLLLGPVLARSTECVRREPLTALLLGFPLLLWLGYSVIGPPLAHRWYSVPAVYFVLVAALLAWGRNFGDRVPRTFSALLAVASLAAGAWLLPRSLNEEFSRELRGPAYSRRVVTYQEIADWLEARALTDLTLLTDEPGYLTYHAKNPVIDSAGLVTEGVFLHPAGRRTPLRSLLDSFAPDLVLGRAWKNPDPSHYRPVLETRTGVTLYATHEVVQARIASLVAPFLAKAGAAGPNQPHSAGFATHFGDGALAGWESSQGSGDWVQRDSFLRFQGKVVRRPCLRTSGALQGTMTSPPFVIDFDELSFRFGANEGENTTAELLVGGVTVLSVGGTEDFVGDLAQVMWCVVPWRGRTAELRFVDRSTRNGFLAADWIESGRYAGIECFDDFESGQFDDRWVQRFAQPPQSTASVGRKVGPAVVPGAFAAATLDLSGAQLLESRSFPIERSRIECYVYDGGGPQTRVELLVDGQIVRIFRGTASGRLLPISWHVADQIGHSATLRVIDDDPSAEQWIGIDEIQFLDR